MVIWLLTAWSLFLVYLLHLKVATGTTCYFPDGSVAQGNLPCDPDGNVSTCCGVASPDGACLANFLCQDIDKKLIRGSCTDQTWSSPFCPQYCLVDQLGGEDVVSCQNVTKSDSTFCCNGDTNCCDSGDGVFTVFPAPSVTFATWNLAASGYVPIATTSSTVAPSSVPPSSKTTLSSETTPSGSSPAEATPSSTSSLSPPTSTASSKLSTGAIAGVVVGSFLGLSAVVIPVFFYFKTRRAKRNQSQPSNTQGMTIPDLPQSNNVGSPQYKSHITSANPLESVSPMPEGFGFPAELVNQSPAIRHELDTSPT
ncbi:hypothetical protein F5Y16DRAFT_399432 [Xylariaceae sp. FL0255]|nr:hypothetical protein F5Y16DRAFT_399432 [Xylariaceae sp. FL0255]